MVKTYLEEAHFLEGSMKPKVEAAIDFVQREGKKSIIASLHNLLLAIEGKTRAHILPD
jgi:carbamate kinase